METPSTPLARERSLPPPEAEREPRPRLALFLPAGLAAAIVWIATAPFGPGLSPDSVQFLAAARNLVAGHGWQRVEGTPFVEWAPLLPAWLALGSRLGLDPLLLARLSGALSAGGIVWAAGLWTSRSARSRLAGLAAALALAVSFPILYVSGYLWSDAPFLFLTLVGVLALGDARQRAGLGPALLAAIPAALACLTRYLGVTLVAAGVVALFARRDRGKRALVYGAVSGVPLFLWLARNVSVSGTATGYREPPGFPILENAAYLLQNAADHLLPWSWPGTLKLALCAAALAAGWLAFRAKHREPLALFTLFYVFAVVVVSSLWGADRMDLRFALPLFVALLAGAFVVAARVRGRVPRAALAVFGLLWFARATIVDAEHVVLYRQSGIPGFADAHERRSETLALLRAHPPYGALYSNEPELAYLSVAPRSVALAPRAHLFYAAWSPVKDLEGFVKDIGERREATLIWFTEAERGALVPVEELSKHVTVREVARAADGVIYRISP